MNTESTSTTTAIQNRDNNFSRYLALLIQSRANTRGRLINGGIREREVNIQQAIKVRSQQNRSIERGYRAAKSREKKREKARREERTPQDRGQRWSLHK